MAPLHTYLSHQDYPPEAIKNREQGTVAYSLTVGVDGHPTGCKVVSSSGSATLDTATCRIMVHRARFTPATDAAGRPMSGTVAGKLKWVLPAPSETRYVQVSESLEAMLSLWSSCTAGETAKLVLSDVSPAEVGIRAFAACTLLEERTAAEMRKAKDIDPSLAIPATKRSVEGSLSDLLNRSRGALKEEKRK